MNLVSELAPPLHHGSGSGGGGYSKSQSSVRRELKHLIGRLEYGSPGGLSGVRVLLVESAVMEQRKSGVGAWSQRMQEYEREVTMAEFVSMAKTSPSGEPPWHKVKLVVSKQPGGAHADGDATADGGAGGDDDDDGGGGGGGGGAEEAEAEEVI